ncbi:MAG: saccharopine dehydrogenase NADP-binding domain-containing protein [Clostridiales Family XIII bacterium]|jgi:saccharopine dehydrogenase-like NADP-dependent oxidoreductase|nr:saccharopine dehydrogenase NADP-binding domain-containing protein [Clostridiales Family XIII bacterium]
MKVLVVGAGGQGGPCASILARNSNVERILLTDLELQAAQKVAGKIGSDKIQTGKLDATDSAAVTAAAKGMDAVIDLVMPWMARHVMQGALQAGAHYVNTAFDVPFWDELAKGAALTLHREFQEANLTALLGMGMAPGFINVLIRQQTDRLDRVDSIKLRLAKGKTGGGPYDDIVSPWNPGWAPIQALKDCANEAICFEDGAYRYMPPYSGIESWKFAEPIGEKLVSHHSHEEPYSLPRTIGKGLRYCDFKYYVSHQPAALVSLGLTGEEEIDVKGVKVKPLDVCAALLPKAGNAFLEEDAGSFEYQDKHVFMDMVAEIKGQAAGRDVTLRISCPKMTAPAKRICELFGTSLVNVALPAVTGAERIVEGEKKGVIFAEELDPARYLEKLQATGYPYRWSVSEET